MKPNKKKIERPKVYYTCSASYLPVIDEKEYFEICLSCRNSKHGLRNDILMLFGCIINLYSINCSFVN